MWFGVLGTLEASDLGRPVALGKPQQRAVLAMLLLEANRVVPLDRIIEDLWDGLPPARAAGTVHACISMLRRVLEPDRVARAPARLLVSQGAGYLLRIDPEDFDASQFERLTVEAGSLVGTDPDRAITSFDSALGLWRGPALADFAGTSWATISTNRLEELRSTAREGRFDALLGSGHGHDVVADLEAAVALAPLRERLWGQLIVALYRSGRQADALRAYQRARHVLADELGIEPSPELQAIEGQVLAHAPELDGRHRTATSVPHTGRVDAQVQAPPDPIFGRDQELADLRQAVEELLNGRGAAFAVTGVAGTGKTCLVDVAFAGTPPARVVWARCVEGDIAPPLWPWLQIASELGPDGVGLADAIRIEPGAAAPTDGAQRAMYEAALRALAAIEGPPTVLVIDDAHWADDASLHIVQLLISRLPQLPVLLVLTSRDAADSAPAAAATLALIARSSAGRRVRLGELDTTAIEQMLLAWRGRPASAATTELIHQRSGGNAFYLTELVRLLDDRGEEDDDVAIARAVPAGVRDMVSQRVGVLPQSSGAALEAAALLGRDFDSRIVATLAGLSAITCLGALDRAIEVGLIRSGASATRYSFCHDLTRQALYESMSLAERAAGHEKALVALAELYGDDPSRTVEIASHAWSGRLLVSSATVIEWLVRAARVARGGYAVERAEQLLERAVEAAREQAPSPGAAATELDVSIRLAHLSSVRRGYSDEMTAERFDRAIELYARVEDRTGVSPEMLMELSSYLSLQGRIDEAAALADSIVAAGQQQLDALTECAGSIQVGVSAWYGGDMNRSAAMIERAIELARNVPRADLLGMFGFPQLGHWLSFLALVRSVQGDLDGSRVAIAESSEQLDRFPDEQSATWADVFSAWRAVVDDDPDAAQRRCARFLARSADTGVGVVQAQADLVEGWALIRLGDPAAALPRIRSGHVGIVAADTEALVLVAVTFEAQALARLGQSVEALELIADMLRAQESTSEGLWLPELHRVRGELLMATDPNEADRALVEAARIATVQGAHGFARRAELDRDRLTPD